MNYHYISELTTKEIDPELLYSDNNGNISIPIICYHINTNTSIPFLQIMLETNYYENNKQLSLPFIQVKNDISNEYINKSIIEKVVLLLLNVDSSQIINDSNESNNFNEYEKQKVIFDGYFINEKTNRCVAFVNISNFDINYLKMSEDSFIWFALISEIINKKCICNTIEISKNTVNFFSSNKDLCLLYTDDNRIFNHNIPDVAYTYDTMKLVEFKSIFGQIPIKNNYYFYTSLRKCLSHMNNIDKEKTYGINRYAIFYNSYDLISDRNIIYDVKINNYEKMYPISYHDVILKISTGSYIII
jgi:hypothetical protein